MTKTVLFVRCISFTFLWLGTCVSNRAREDHVDILTLYGKPTDDAGILYSRGIDGYPAFKITSKASIYGKSSAEYFKKNSLYKNFAITTILRLMADSATLFAVVNPYGINQFGVDLANTVRNSKSQTIVTIYYTSDISRNKQRSDVLAVFYLPDISNQWTVLGIKVQGTTVELYRDCELVESKAALQRNQLVFMRGSILYLASNNQNNKYIGDLMEVKVHRNPGKASTGTCEYNLSGSGSGNGEDIDTDDEDLINMSGSGSGNGEDIDIDEDLITERRTCTSTLGEKGERGEPGELGPFGLPVHQGEKGLGCPDDTDYLGIPWEIGIPGKYMRGHCPKGTEPGFKNVHFINSDVLMKRGWVERCCDENGIYHDPIYSCTHSDIADAYKKLFYDPSETNTIGGILDDLVMATTGEVLLIGDIEAVTEILSKITDVVQANFLDIQNITNSFIQVANNLMEQNLTKTWKVIMNQKGSGADVVIDILDQFVEQIVTAPDSKITTAAFAKTNLMLKINTNVSCDRTIQFPNRTHDDVPTWAIDTVDSIKVPCLQSDQKRQYSSAMYRDVSDIVPAKVKGNKFRTQSAINAPVMSFTYYPIVVENLEDPIEITFQVYNESTHHLTLTIITMTGCIISMICLFLTLLVYVILWRTVQSVRSIIHINLASTLFVAYLLFLTGINRTENKGVCTAIAVLLHLLYLIVFFIMLTEGLVLAYTVWKPLSTRKPGLPLLVACYVLSAVIVGISMAVVELEGYGNESFCWLSTKMGLTWTFITPVLFVILINSIIICLVIIRMCGTAAMFRRMPMEKAKAGLRSILILMPIMGITWVFGIFSVNEDAVIFQYLFAIFNSLQGLLIFIFQCVMDRKVKEGLKRMFGWSKFQSTSGSSSADAQNSNKRTRDTKETNV